MKSHKIQRVVHCDLLYYTTKRLKQVAGTDKARPLHAKKYFLKF